MTGFTANIPTVVLADSRLLKQDTNQRASCDTVGANSPVSDSCNQRAANNVNNGISKPTSNTLTFFEGKYRIVCASFVPRFHIAGDPLIIIT